MYTKNIEKQLQEMIEKSRRLNKKTSMRRKFSLAHALPVQNYNTKSKLHYTNQNSNKLVTLAESQAVCME